MKLSKMKKEDLELYSYDELTKLILEEEKKPLNTQAIFKKICELLELTDEEYADKIGDFYTNLTTDKDFVLLADGNWDLRDHHPASTNFTDDEETYGEEDLEDIEEAEEDMEEIIDDEGEMDDDGDDLDEEEDLSIIDEEELEN